MAELRTLASPASRPIRAVAVLALLLAALGSGCESEGESEGTQVIATTGILADVAAEVAGPDAEVTQLIPDAADPHSFSLSAEDRLDLEQADLVVANGLGLEAGVPLEETEAPVWTLSEHAGELVSISDGDATGADDPHIWMDPTRVAQALPSLADAIGEVDRTNAAAYRGRSDAYADRLSRLDDELAETLAGNPHDRQLVTSHDSLAYLADRYDLEIVATAFPPSGAEAEVSAEQLSDVEDAVRASGVPTVFAQQGDDPEVLEIVAAETAVRIETGLLVESPGPAGSYDEMLRLDAELIAQGLRR